MRGYQQKNYQPKRRDASQLDKLSKAVSGISGGNTIQLKVETGNKKQAEQQISVPPIVNKVISSPGEPLGESARSFFEPRFGHDFSKVRVHSDRLAGESALRLGAQAYTVGRDVVFGTGYYSPETQPGRHLLAHELTHVVQQGSQSPTMPLKLAPPQDDSEQLAESMSVRTTEQQPSIKSSPETRASSAIVPGSSVQRSLLGGILGGIGGALGGALVGGMLGGPIGAVVGGVVGLVAGALIGDSASTQGRALTTTEIAYAKDIYKDSIDYSQIKITRDSMLATGAPRTIGNTIHLKSDWRHFKGDTLELSPEGLQTLIHEMGHVWQYQNGGIAYIPESLWAQLKAKLSGKSRGAAYDWRAAHAAKIPWEEWNPEQQAEAIEDYNKLLRKSKDGTATVPELAELSTLLPYMENVWQRKGAPTWEPPAMGSAPI